MQRFFLLLGAQKSGTTWLARLLASHPDVFIPLVQEIHYFDTKHGFYDKNRKLQIRRESILGLLETAKGTPQESGIAARLRQIESLIAIDSDDSYRSFFKRYAADVAVAGEKTPNYAVLSPQAFKEMAEIFPGALLLFVLRNPVERFWSQFRFHAERRRQNDSRRPIKSFDDPYEALREGPFALKNDYRSAIEKIKAAAPPERVFLDYYEKLTSGGDSMLGLFEFLGVPPFAAPRMAAWRSQRINESPIEPMPETLRRHVAKELRPMYDFVFRNLPGDPPQQWLADYNLD